MIEKVGNVIFGADQQVAGWVAERIPSFQFGQNCRALGVMKDGKMAAGIVFDNFNGVHIEAAIAADPGSSWADRQTLGAMFCYPFVTLGCQAISVSVPETNLASLNLATKLGFEPEALVRFAAHDGSTLVILKMFRDNCRWIVSYGKKRRLSSSGPESEGNGGGRVPVQQL